MTKEIENDGYITREEDLMPSRGYCTVRRYAGDRTAKEMTRCDYPNCEDCADCVDDYCTVPIVVNKQLYLFTEEKLFSMEKELSEVKNLVYDEILGEERV